MYLANDKYNTKLRTTFIPGASALQVFSLPSNVPTIVTVGFGTDHEAVFSVQGVSGTNPDNYSLTGISLLRGYDGVLEANLKVECLNNEEFFNQVNGKLIPNGGLAGQALIKHSDTNNDVEWGKVDTVPVGVINQFAGSTAPEGWLICDGSEVSRSTYSDLFNVIGTTYGSGDGSTTFNLPNLKGRVSVGLDGSQAEFNSLGKTGGEKTHILTIAEMPSHTHTQNAHKHWISAAQRDDGNGTGTSPSNRSQNYGLWADAGSYYIDDPSYYGGRYCKSTTATNQNTGGGQSHNNLQPYITLNYIIKV